MFRSWDERLWLENNLSHWILWIGSDNVANSEPDTSAPCKIKSNIVGKTVKIATLDVKGLNFPSARRQLIYLIKKHNIDIVATQETKVNYTGKEQHGDFLLYFSSVVEDDRRKRTEAELEKLKIKVKKNEISEHEAKQERLAILNMSAEKLGVGFVF